jgi:hypothetical protein
VSEQWVVVWRYSAEWCQDCGLRGSENDIGRKFLPERDRFMPMGGPQLEPSLTSKYGLPRKHRYLGYNLAHGCMGCNGTGRTATRYRFEASAMFSTLTDKQKMVMSHRLGFADGKSWKQTELAKHLGISQPAVHKHERLAKKKFHKKVVNTLGLMTDGYISHTYAGEYFAPQSGNTAVLRELKELRRDIAKLTHKADMDELRWHNLLMRHSLGELNL